MSKDVDMARKALELLYSLASYFANHAALQVEFHSRHDLKIWRNNHAQQHLQRTALCPIRLSVEQLVCATSSRAIC